MGRAPCCDKANVKKGPWSPEEDAKLKNFINTYGTGGNWITLPTKAGLKRCGKSCRLRWINYLRPDIKHGGFTEEEEETIIKLHEKVGSRWSLIASKLKGRTDNDIKNYWNTRLKKKLAEKALSSRVFHGASSTLPLYTIGLRQDAAMGQTLLSREHFMHPVSRSMGPEMKGGIRHGTPILYHLEQQFEQWQQTQQQHAVPVKNELLTENELDDVPDAQRLMNIQNELIDMLRSSPKETTTAMSSDLGSSQSEVLHPQQESPDSSCSTERCYGGQLDCDNVSSIWNGYGEESSALVGVQCRTLPLPSDALSPLPLQEMPNISPIQEVDSSSAISTTHSRHGLLGDLIEGRVSGQTTFLSGMPIDRPVVKEEFCDDLPALRSDLFSPTTPRSSVPSRNWSVRCGDGLSAAAHGGRRWAAYS